MTTPVVYQYQQQSLAPYVTLDEFKTYPTWMDVGNLVPGNVTTGIQDAALSDVLLAASQWAENYVGNMPLRAHVLSSNTRARTNRRGRLYLKPEHVPVRQVVSLSYAPDPNRLIGLNLAASPPWIEGQGREVSFTLSGQLFFTGPMLQFGNVPSPEQETFIAWTYVAGWPNTVLSSAPSGGASSISVADPTGILPGDQLRIWDDANVATEVIYVQSTYVPPVPAWPPVAGAIPVTPNLAKAHNIGVGVGEMPRPVHQAVICYAIGLLMREDVAGERPFAGSPMGPSIRRSQDSRGKAGGLLSEAERLLTKYVNPRWG
jgi:hypothetical protein